MSKVRAHTAHPIPIGIPVSPPPKAAPSERPTPRRKAAPRERVRQIPWLLIVTGGSAVWAILIVAVGVCMNTQTLTPGEPEPAVRPLAILAPVPKPAPQETPLILLEEAEGIDADLQPIAPAPNLPKVPPPAVRDDETPPPIALSPPKQGVPVVIVKPTPEPPVQPKRQDADPEIYASCEQIGSDILFMKNPVDAFKKARDEKKLVFIVHLSGNLEDPGCT